MTVKSTRGKRRAVKPACYVRIAEHLQPVRRVRIRAASTGIEQNRNDKRQLFISRIEMSLHGGYGVTHQAKGHVTVGARLMLYKNVNVAVTLCRPDAIEYVTVIGTKIFFHKAARLKSECAEIAYRAKLCGHVWSFARGIRVGQESLKKPHRAVPASFCYSSFCFVPSLVRACLQS